PAATAIPAASAAIPPPARASSPIMSTAIDVSPVAGRSDLAAFIQLPKRLYRGLKGYVAPLDMERREALSPKTNPFFEHAEVQLFLARRDGKVVGRISAQIDR